MLGNRAGWRDSTDGNDEGVVLSAEAVVFNRVGICGAPVRAVDEELEGDFCRWERGFVGPEGSLGGWWTHIDLRGPIVPGAVDCYGDCVWEGWVADRRWLRGGCLLRHFRLRLLAVGGGCASW